MWLAILPILEFGLVFVLKLVNVIPYVINLGFGISVLSLGLVLLQLLMMIILRKTRVPYYLIYLYIIVVTVLSVLL